MRRSLQLAVCALLAASVAPAFADPMAKDAMSDHAMMKKNSMSKHESMSKHGSMKKDAMMKKDSMSKDSMSK